MSKPIAQWNVKNAISVSDAVLKMRHDYQSYALGADIDLQEQLIRRESIKRVMEEVKRLASDEYYQANGSADYREFVEKHFSISKRRGYVVLSLNEDLNQ